MSTLPQVLAIKDGEIVQRPDVKELFAHLGEPIPSIVKYVEQQAKQHIEGKHHDECAIDDKSLSSSAG